jgi:hypothetical protein
MGVAAELYVGVTVSAPLHPAPAPPTWWWDQPPDQLTDADDRALDDLGYNPTDWQPSKGRWSPVQIPESGGR